MMVCKLCHIVIITAGIFINSLAIAEEPNEMENMREAIEVQKRELNMQIKTSEEQILELNNRIKELEENKKQAIVAKRTMKRILLI
jgi:flagellar motility protein MotE (MotC chaperone)